MLVKSLILSCTEEGTFGVPFEVLIERTGVESNLGAGPSRLRIPSFIEDSLSILKQMGRCPLMMFALLLNPCLRMPSLSIFVNFRK